MNFADVLRSQGGTLESAVVAPDSGPGDPGPAQLAASGPRVAAQAGEYELLIEMIFEGSLLHYSSPRFLETDDRDLALLLGDQLYALGLSRLAALGDLEAIAELADVISLVAQAHTSGDTELAAAVWEAGAVAVGWGQSEEHRVAKGLVRSGDPDAPSALRSAAKTRRRQGS